MKYLLIAEARWVESCEHPGGKRDDIHTPKSQTLSVTFDAATPRSARFKVKDRLADFLETLPKKREGSLSWQRKDPEIVSVVFARVLAL
jgi:hypothetical protein